MKPKRPAAPMITHVAAILIGCTFALAACSSGLGTDDGTDSGVPQPSRSTEIGLGVDLGFALAERINDDYSVAGAEIPGATEAETRRVSFIAFTTATSNLDADGLGIGTALSREASPPADGNGETDVYIMAIEDILVDQDGMGPQPAAFSRALVNTFRHSRCVNCHAMGSTPEPGEPFVFPGNNTHPGPAQPILVDGCTSCHEAPGVAPEVEWRAPRENNGQPFNMRNDTVAELAARAQSVPFMEHLLNDTRVTWAIESAAVPFAGGLAGSSDIWIGVPDVDVGPVPISFATFRAQLLAWEAAGFPVTAEDSVRDVVLVSRALSSGSAANGASVTPAITWVPNPSYDPTNPSAQPAGEIVVAYASTATNIVSGGNANADIYRSRVSVSVDRDPATGAVLAGGLDLTSDPSTNELVSLDANGSASNGDSSAPAIDASGDMIVFASDATDLVTGFTDQNGAGSDVYLADLSLGSTVLVSADSPGGTAGGDQASGSPAISMNGVAIAFESDATNLVAGDANGVTDILFTTLVAGTLDPLTFASVATNGAQADGASTEPSVAVGASGIASVVFTSEATNLAAVGAPTNVFLRENGRTTNLSQRRSSGTTELANGSSVSPHISPSGNSVIYTTSASNLDVVQPVDRNGADDILLVDIEALRSDLSIEGRRITLDSAGQDADAESSQGRIGSFRDASGAFFSSSFSFFRSSAEDLGVTRQDIVAVSVDEGVSLRTDFTADDPVGPSPLTVAFTDTSNGGPTAWLWDFGDGATSSDQNPSHTYAASGNFSVSLTVTREEGMDSVVKDDFIRALDPLAISSISADNLSGAAPLTATFDSVLTGSQEDIEFLWDFGDGNSSTSAMPSNTYMAAGSYDVSLTVTGAAGTDTLTEVGFIDVAVASGANFSFSQNGLRTTFTNLSAGSPASFLWDFGDGSSSTQENPVHTYDNNGPRTVSLTINGPGGMDSTSRVVTVNALEFGTTIFPYFASNGCTSCHGGATPSGGLLIDGASASALHSALVGELVQGSSCNNGVRRRVVAFDSAASLLVEIVDPAITACNNSAGMGTWTSGQLVDVRRWINEGATFD